MEKGKIYKVVKFGGILKRTVDCGNWSWVDKRIPLPLGTILTYAGAVNGWGSDSVPIDNFTYENENWEFWPNSWGICDKSFFEEIL